MRLLFAIFLGILYYAFSLLFYEASIQLVILIISNSPNSVLRPETLGLLQFSFSSIQLIIVIFVVRYLNKKYEKKSKPKLNISLVIFSIIAGSCYFYLDWVITWIYIEAGLDNWSSNVISQPIIQFENTHIVSLIITILIVPIREELFFKLLLLKNLRNHYSIFLSVMISSLLFAMNHYHPALENGANLHHIFLALVFGILSGLLYVKTERIIYVILFHVFVNLIASLDAYIDIPFTS